MMGRTHCMGPVGIAAWLFGPDPGPIIVAGSAGVLPDIDEIKRQWGNGFGLQNITHSFGGLAGAVILAMR
jgi:hypothetical protein